MISKGVTLEPFFFQMESYRISLSFEYLSPGWLDSFKAEPSSFHLVLFLILEHLSCSST